jgi:hypothetical protein
LEDLMLNLKKAKFLLYVAVLGFLGFLLTGLVERPGIGIIEVKQCGYPLVWRITDLNAPTQYLLANIVADIVFWAAVALVVLFAADKVHIARRDKALNLDMVLLVIVLFLPLGILMDLVHECGHAFWGTLMGGRLTYMQVTCLILYPQLSLTPNFVLGMVVVSGLSTPFAFGVMSLGGSLSTTILAWILGLLLHKLSLGRNSHVALSLLGLFGILDMPFYVVFPQLGLQHWIFLGGGTSEPLIGAQNMGIPTPIFCFLVALSTLGLLLLYSNGFRKRLRGTLTFRIFKKVPP